LMRLTTYISRSNGRLSKMPDEDYDVRDYIQEQKHIRGDCDSNCWYCEAEAEDEEESIEDFKEDDNASRTVQD